MIMRAENPGLFSCKLCQLVHSIILQALWIFKMLLAQHGITSQKRRICSNTNNRTSHLAKTVITSMFFFSKVKKLILVQEQYISVN